MLVSDLAVESEHYSLFWQLIQSRFSNRATLQDRQDVVEASSVAVVRRT